MNRNKKTFLVFIALFALVALSASYVLAKDDPTTSSVRPVTPPGSVTDQKDEINPNAIIPEDDPTLAEDSKISPNKPGSEQKDLTATYLAESFSVSVPPAGWSEIIFNAGYNWKYQTLTYYSSPACADVEYDPSLASQNEWLVTPVLNFVGASAADLKVEFWWMMSYYWGVSPYDNYDYELWISTDGGATWPTKLWDESGEGVFTNWTWYKESIPLSGYAGFGFDNVKLAWRYVGADGAQLGLDNVSIDDNPAPIGRCCYGAGQCADNTEAQCAGLTGDWDGSLNCTANPCPVPGVGDNCGNPIIVKIPANLPYTDANQFTCGRIDDYNATCLGSYDGGEDIIYEIQVSITTEVDIKLDPKGTAWTGFALDELCPLAASGCIVMATNSGTAMYQVKHVVLNPGTYYLMVDTYPSPTCIPAFDLMIIVSPPPQPGEICSSAIPINISPALLPLTVANQNNCGLINDYANTCLGSYDGGEDIIYQLNVTQPIYVDIDMNPKGTTYTGFLVDNICPPNVTTCIKSKTNSGGALYTMTGVNLPVGTYYIMVDTWPSPTCIPNFDLTFRPAAGPPANDTCYKATPISDVTALPFSTNSATFDGPGGYITSPNIWYCYTATCTGNVTVDLCGSSYDTKVRVWSGCACPPTVMVAQDDDACDVGLQSIVTFPATAGQKFLIEVGGYSANVGNGLLTVSCCVPPWNDLCTAVTPVVLTPTIPVMFMGDNTCSANDCSYFPSAGETWEAFTITQCMDVTLDYCTTSPAFGNAWLNLALGCPCTGFTAAGTFNTTSCGDGNVTITWLGLQPGTYYYPVMRDPAYGAEGPYILHVVAYLPAAYCAASGGCDEYISRVRVGDIDNSSGCSNYANYSAISTDMCNGIPYPFIVDNGTPYSSDQCGVWADWNEDLCFDATEQIAVVGTPGGGPYSGVITPPLGTSVGEKRLRIRITYTGAVAPCGTTTYGEVEDYTISIFGDPVFDVSYNVIVPDTEYVYSAFALDPYYSDIYVTDFGMGRTVLDVNMSTVQVNGLAVTSSIAAHLPGDTDCRPALRCNFTWRSFVLPYGELYDTTLQTYTVTGLFTDATPFSSDGSAGVIGKSSVTKKYIVPNDRVIIRADNNSDAIVNIADVVYLIQFIFNGGPAPIPQLVGDANCSTTVNIADAVHLILFVFSGGPAPCPAQ